MNHKHVQLYLYIRYILLPMIIILTNIHSTIYMLHGHFSSDLVQDPKHIRIVYCKFYKQSTMAILLCAQLK